MLPLPTLGGSCIQRPGCAVCSPRADAAVPLLPRLDLAPPVQKEFPAVLSWALRFNPGNARGDWLWGCGHSCSCPCPRCCLSPNTASLPSCCSSLPWRGWLPISAEPHCSSRPHRLLLCPIINMKFTYSCLPQTCQRLQSSPLC